MTTCTLSPADKKTYAIDVAKILVEKHGKQKSYSPLQVKKASQQTKYELDWHCWAMSLYTSQGDFNAYHDSIGETCDYASMKAEMAYDITDGASESWFDFDLSWLDWPDLELSSIFNAIDI